MRSTPRGRLNTTLAFMEKAPARAIVRRGQPAEHAQLLELDALSRAHPERAAFLATALRDGDCLVAEVEGRPRGFVVLKHGSFFGFDFIPLIVVAAESRRLGLGLHLLAAASERCPSGKLFTSTSSSNAGAHELLLRAGFSRSGVVENLDEGDSEIVYFRPALTP